MNAVVPFMHFLSTDLFPDELYYKKSSTTDGTPRYWHGNLSIVPRDFSIFIANEFFDILPILKIKRVEGGWQEILIDIDEGTFPIT